MARAAAEPGPGTAAELLIAARRGGLRSSNRLSAPRFSLPQMNADKRRDFADHTSPAFESTSHLRSSAFICGSIKASYS